MTRSTLVLAVERRRGLDATRRPVRSDLPLDQRHGTAGGGRQPADAAFGRRAGIRHEVEARVEWLSLGA